MSYNPPFYIISSEPTIATFGSQVSLDEARAYVSKLQGCGLCLKGAIGCYHKTKGYLTVESFDVREDVSDVAS